MSELMDRFLGFMPHRATILMALGLSMFMIIIQRLSDWVTKKVQLPWMEEKNQQQRKALEQDEKK